MKKAIDILESKRLELEMECETLRKANQIASSDLYNKVRSELREVIEEIEDAIRILKCKREIEILEALIDDGRLKEPE